MSDICEHETFRDICGVCHRNTIIEKQETEITTLRAVNDALSEQMMTMIDNAAKVAELPDGAGVVVEAAARIERLEKALREIAKVTRGWEPGVWSEEEGRQYFSGLFFSAQKVASAALGWERLSNITHEVRDNPEKIWLEPGCSPERCWSETRLDDCEEHGCGAKAVAYVREDIVDTIRAVGNSLGEQLQSMIDNAGKVATLRAENERVRAALERFASEFARVNPLRRATMHDPECRCLWCAYDNARAALQETKNAD